MTTPSDLPVHRFADQAAFEAWLEAEHERSPGIYVLLAKKGAPEPTLKQSEMVESLLCFGWIDGQVKGLDEHHFLTRVTPRRPRSVWSAKNGEWAGRLIEAGRMRPAGLREVERAKADGRWEAAYESWGTAQVPDDLAEALAASDRAREAFEGLDSRNRYSILYRIGDAKRPETRARRIATFVAMLEAGERLYP